jgi:hypothetical protein
MKLRTDGVTWQEIDGELVLLDMQTSAYLTTNVAGAVLAKLLVEERDQADLADALVAEFGIDRETADADAANFVDQLREKGLLA